MRSFASSARLAWSAAALLIPVCLGRAAAGQAPPLRVTRLGSADDFGPGILNTSNRQVHFLLARPAHVIVLRVDREGSIEPVFPLRDGDSTQYQTGLWAIDAPLGGEAPPPQARAPVLSSTELARTARRAPPPGEDLRDPPLALLDYWLVIVSDVPTSAADVRGQLESMDLKFQSVKAELQALPRALLAGRTRSWAAYYAPTQP